MALFLKEVKPQENRLPGEKSKADRGSMYSRKA